MPTVRQVSPRVTPPALSSPPLAARDRGGIASVHWRRVVDAAPSPAGDGVELRVLGADGQPLLIERRVTQVAARRREPTARDTCSGTAVPGASRSSGTGVAASCAIGNTPAQMGSA